MSVVDIPWDSLSVIVLAIVDFCHTRSINRLYRRLRALEERAGGRPDGA